MFLFGANIGQHFMMSASRGQPVSDKCNVDQSIPDWCKYRSVCLWWVIRQCGLIDSDWSNTGQHVSEWWKVNDFCYPLFRDLDKLQEPVL